MSEGGRGPKKRLTHEALSEKSARWFGGLWNKQSLREVEEGSSLKILSRALMTIPGIGIFLVKKGTVVPPNN